MIVGQGGRSRTVLAGHLAGLSRGGFRRAFANLPVRSSMQYQGKTPPVRFYEYLRRHHAVLLRGELTASEAVTARMLHLSQNMFRRLRAFVAKHPELVRTAAETNDWAAVEAEIFSAYPSIHYYPSYARMWQRLGKAAGPKPEMPAPAPTPPPKPASLPELKPATVSPALVPALPAANQATQPLVRRIQLGELATRYLTPAALAAIGQPLDPAAGAGEHFTSAAAPAVDQTPGDLLRAHQLARQILLGEWVERHLTAEGMAVLLRSR